MTKYPKPVSTWGIKWRSASKLNGVTEHIVSLNLLPVLFKTRKQARRHIEDRFGYMRNRPDLRCEPHGWKIPVAIRVTTAVDGYHLHPGNEVKLKRDNAMMRRWLKMAFVAEHFVRAHKEIERKMPGLFAGGKKGK